MKKIYAVLLLAMFSPGVYAQNVGKGNPTPTEKLDVNGNINVTGTIKVNGTDGTANQVLRKSNAGDLLLGDMNEYKNRVVYSSSNSFIIPAGITRVMVEAWGAGGGGNVYGGGGGQGFFRAVFKVVAGNTITFSMNAGGSGALDAGADNGITTTVSVNNNDQSANALEGRFWSTTFCQLHSIEKKLTTKKKRKLLLLRYLSEKYYSL